MKERLLNKTLRVHLMYSAAILLVTAPLFYLFTTHWYRVEAREALEQRLTTFRQSTLPGFRIADTAQFNHWNPDTRILSSSQTSIGPHYQDIQLPNGLNSEMEPYFELKAHVSIENRTFLFTTRVNLLDSLDTIRNIALLYVLILLLMLAGLLLITRWETVKIWRPYYRTLAALEAFEIDKSGMPDLPESDIEEFHRLRQSVERLISRNLTIFQSQREFVENAAHELQTPLAILQLRLDNLIQDSRLNENQSNALSDFADSIQRLTHLNKNLLLLSRLEHDRYIDNRSVDLADALRRQIEFSEEQAVDMGVTISTGTIEDTSITANPVLVDVLLGNLASNSLRHNRQGGRIHFSLEQGRVTVSNSGDQSLDQDKLFNRFSRLAEGGKGTGLGLSIAKKVADRYGWKLGYAFREGEHEFILDTVSAQNSFKIAG